MQQLSELILASGSPRRAAILEQLALRFQVRVTHVDESALAGETPETLVCRLATEKCEAGFRAAGSATATLGADTIVVLDGEILGKPGDLDEAAVMLEALSGQQHSVLSAVTVCDAAGELLQALNTTQVYFADMPLRAIRWYCANEKPLDKAGAYAIQGFTGQYIRRIEGSYTGVMGLPMFETCKLLRQAGVLSA